ncbi:MAG TPA: glycosyltransferase family 39 protein [Gemmatimonadales bacterium]|nr:glycosyltransferase family 39 protein [Gemmatimonadales bacterium]
MESSPRAPAAAFSGSARRPESTRSGPEILAAVSLGLGIALRVLHLVSGRSLWIDEARLALSIGRRSYPQLVGPLDYDQAAAPLFLLGQKAVSQLLGMGEWSLRLVPFAAGIGTIFLLWKLANRLLPPLPAALVVSMASLGPYFVHYSAELKQYSVDVLVGCFLILSAVEWLGPPVPASRCRRLLVGGTLAVWLSATAPFVLAGVATGGVLRWPGMGRAARRYLVLFFAMWAASFGLAYLLAYRFASDNAYLSRFWSAGFVGLGSWEALHASWAAIRNLLCGLLIGWSTEWPLSPWSSLIASLLTVGLLVLCGIGLRDLRMRHGWWIVGLIGGGLGSALIASAFNLYPVAMRTMFFSAPFLLLALGGGVARVLADRELGARRWVAAGLVGGLLLPPLLWSLGRVANSARADGMRPAVQVFAQNASSGEPVYVFAGAIPAWLFYTTDWSKPDRGRLDRYAQVASSEGAAFENAPSRQQAVTAEGDHLVYRVGERLELLGLATGYDATYLAGPTRDAPDPGWMANEARRIHAVGAKSFWLVFSHFYGLEPYLVKELERRGARRVFDYQREGVLLFRYVFD